MLLKEGIDIDNINRIISFNPKTITFLTLFSPRTTKQFKNIKFKI